MGFSSQNFLISSLIGTSSPEGHSLPGRSSYKEYRHLEHIKHKKAFPPGVALRTVWKCTLHLFHLWFENVNFASLGLFKHRFLKLESVKNVIFCCNYSDSSDYLEYTYEYVVVQ
uniref:Uncharacterized protein n=1 Tax=Cacopsylla melanoneura TaxID=428564 RepID=A0A8D9EMQ5_9HEMI